MNFYSIFYSYILFSFSSIHVNVANVCTDLPTVVKWAQDISEELWKIGSTITKLENIQERYKSINASVEITDGEEILKTIATRMNKLIKEKVDAVLKIKNAAMNAESSFSFSENPDDVTYYNSKFSNVVVSNSNLKNESDYERPDDLNYTEMILAANPHFDNVLVNTSYSSVHVPTNIFDRWENVIRPIQWSEALDETFRSNYETDSSIMWQYFASTTGFLRHYPAFHWAIHPDRYDCRDSIWYIQAATCSKEVVILIDNSGTMYGMKNTIAQLTVDFVLKTFSNNDYINIFRLYEDNVTCLVPCFNDTLIQATPENIDLFKNGLYSMCPEKKINYKKGFSTAYKLLHDFIKNKTEQVAENHNQAIFLLTDTLPTASDKQQILEEYQNIYNDTNIQVELFIYFIGNDITDIKEVQWETCLRNGSIVHVRTMDEVPEDALKYLSVMARTQNESTEYYPVSWTHIFLDIKKDKGKVNDTEDTKEEAEMYGEDFKIYGKLEQCRIMTSVSAPVYSSKIKKDFAQFKQEELIGVAAIDVPVSDFERLTMAHKIGVNGYAFVVTNNGYLLFHPDLRPVKDGVFRKNFNSIDLTEVEFYDDNEDTPRKPNELMVELRKRMVNQEMASMTEVPIKFHYDDQKRVGCEKRNYFFAPLKCSPFSLGLALPGEYGNFWVKTTNEIENSKISKENYKEFFKGNWQIHPKWSYCDYRDNRKYEFTNSEEKLMTFFDMIFNNNSFVWVEEHVEDLNISNYNNSDSFENCFGNDTTKKPNQPYFCDKELLELLYFDAKLTQNEFPEQISKDDIDLMKKKKIRVKFVATQGGLTRWQNSPEYQSGENFGKKYNKALDEVWYKSAVLLHEMNSQNFVFSLSDTQDNRNKNEKFITAAHAIFHKQGENKSEAPGVVVGYQISHDILKNQINKFPPCESIESPCDCYIIDQNGYIIHSPREDEIGKFFGTVDGGAAAMGQMVKDKIFREISMFDYQAIDDEKNDPVNSASSSIFNPLNFVVWMLNWAVSRIVWLLVETNIWQYVNAASSCSSVTFTNMNTSCTTCKLKNKTCPICCKAPKKYSDACQTREVLPHIEDTDDRPAKPKKRPVDKKFSLYLNTGLNSSGYQYYNKNNMIEKCSRPFYAVKINRTNLILIVIDTSHETCPWNLSIEQKVITYDSPYKDTPGCNKRMINSYPRKKLRGCSDKMPQNRTRELCNSGINVKININLLLPLYCFFLILLLSLM